MKLGHLLFAASLLGAPTAYAQHDHDHGSVKAAPAAHRATGVVKSVNAEKGTITIAHDPVPSLQWPAMTMNFKASDPKILAQAKAGAKVDFAFEQRGKDYVITSIH